MIGLTPTLTAPISDHGSTPVAPSHAATAASIANRRAMPTVTAVIDQLRSVFGPVKVVFAEEAGHELGKAPDPGVIVHPPHVPGKSRKRGR